MTRDCYVSKNSRRAFSVAPGISSATKWPDEMPTPVISGAKVERQMSSGCWVSPLVPLTR